MTWRWGVAVLLTGGLVATPSLIASRPVQGASVDPTALLARIRTSAAVGWSGYGESRGAVALPKVIELGDLTSILGTTTRYRVWWHDAVRHRVDALSLTGEQDTTDDATGSWRWSSDSAAAVRITGTPSVQVPEEPDLVAPTLGRRLAGTQDVELSKLPVRRVGRRSVPGVRLTPAHPATTTIEHVDLYADPRSGLVLEVDVQAVGQRVPVMRSLLLSVDLSRPDLSLASFLPTQDRTTVSKEDLVARLDQHSPYALPTSLGGLPETHLLTGVTGLKTYGQGFGQVVLIPLPRGSGRSLARSVNALGGRFDTALLHGLLVGNPFNFHQRYLLLGSVPTATLEAMSQDLTLHPPAELP